MSNMACTQTVIQAWDVTLPSPIHCFSGFNYENTLCMSILAKSQLRITDYKPREPFALCQSAHVLKEHLAMPHAPSPQE